MADPTIWLERRFMGPGNTERGYTGQGGYFCGRMAQIAPTARTIKITSKAGVQSNARLRCACLAAQ